MSTVATRLAHLGVPAAFHAGITSRRAPRFHIVLHLTVILASVASAVAAIAIWSRYVAVSAKDVAKASHALLYDSDIGAESLGLILTVLLSFIRHLVHRDPDDPLLATDIPWVARTVSESGKSAILLGGEALSETGMIVASRIAAIAGADLLCDTFFARMERGGGLPIATRLPYFPDQARQLTSRYDHVIVIGTRRPVAFFGYPGLPSYLTEEGQTVMLAGPQEDALGALSALAAQLHAPGAIGPMSGSPPDMPTGALDAQSVSAIIARLQPPNCIVMDEALTVGVPYFDASKHAPRFTHLMLTGGAIGEGPGAATGAAVACPQRKVINFESDGCGAYSVQAFWTQARENLDVVTIIGSNRSYNILNVELLRAGVTQLGAVSRSMTGLDKPYLDWVKIGEGFGVPSVAVDTAEALARELEMALVQKGPRLIEAIMA
jgi:acetolactate synthase-1/2/3 large subunit